ncbi:MAG: carbonic anhydrase [Eubacteriales bacterium]|jgi:carbonic anhydrase
MNLKSRFEKFKELEYEPNRDFYNELVTGQKPHTLFIGCSDSRVNAETLLQAKAGELFQIRNIANMIPREEEAKNHNSVASAVEYAVKVLNVKNILVCGHSNCGGCAAIRKLAKDKNNLPYTEEWISQSVPLSDHIDCKHPDMNEDDKLIMLEKLNAVQQLDNLMTYEFIRKKVESGNLNLQACYYDIGTGSVALYDYDGLLSAVDCEHHTEKKS